MAMEDTICPECGFQLTGYEVFLIGKCVACGCRLKISKADETEDHTENDNKGNPEIDINETH
jgi:hypothetical protein